MDWTEICIHTSQEAVEAISNILHEAGSGGVVIEDPKDLITAWDTSFGEVYELNPNDYPETGVFLKGYFSSDQDVESNIDSIRYAIEQLARFDIDIGPHTIKVRSVNDEDWATAWKQYYKPIQVSDRITIKPTWEQYEAIKQDEMIIELDPGMAFGTGTHQTTILCIQALEKHMQLGDHVIDIGTGTGILSIAAALLGAEKVAAYDLDPVAVRSAEENIRLNGLHTKIDVGQSNLLENIDKTADVIVANLLADIVIRLAGDVPKALKKNGMFIASGIIQKQQRAVEEALASNGFIIEEVMQKDDWIAIIARNVGE